MIFEYYNKFISGLDKLDIRYALLENSPPIGVHPAYFNPPKKEFLDPRSDLVNKHYPLIRRAKLFNITKPATQFISEEMTRVLHTMGNRDASTLDNLQPLPFDNVWFEFANSGYRGVIEDVRGVFISRFSQHGKSLVIPILNLTGRIFVVTRPPFKKHQAGDKAFTRALALKTNILLNLINNEKLTRRTIAESSVAAGGKKYESNLANQLRDVINIDVTPGITNKYANRLNGKNKVDWNHCWQSRGHWRKLPDGWVGKDHEGNRCVEGKTWVKESTRGDKTKPLISRTRKVTYRPTTEPLH